MSILGLLLVPFLVTVVSVVWLKHTITLKESLVQLAAVTAVIVAGFLITRHFGLSDIEHLHGRITKKDHGSQKCCHCRQVCNGYRNVKTCTARDSKGKCTSHGSKRECTGYHEECDHSRDYWWALQTTLGRISVDTCESRESAVPALWANALLGEPATLTHEYKNYLKADPESLIVHDVESKYRDSIPEYPQIYSLYKVNPVISDGPEVPPTWPAAIRDINADFGAAKQVDVTVLLTKVQDPTYAQAVEAKWLYGPKNSLTIVLGVQRDVVTWARVVTISRVERLKIDLRDGLQGRHLSEDVPGLIRSAIQSSFHRTPMAEFEYLATTGSPPTGWLIFLYILGGALSCALSAWLHRADVFGDEPISIYSDYNRRF